MEALLTLVSLGFRVFFARHSLAAGVVEGETDKERTLSAGGIKRVAKTREVVPVGGIRVIFFNPAQRCSETAVLLAERCGQKPNFAVLPMLYVLDPLTPGSQAINEGYKKIGDAPLAAYDNIQGCTEALTDHAETLLWQMDQWLKNTPSFRGDVMVVTHGTTAAAMARHLAQVLKLKVDVLNHFHMQPCSVVDVGGRGVVCHSPVD